MNSLREFICFNQKEIVRFEYTISQLHKEFRKSVNKSDIDSQEEKYNTLILESFNLLENIFTKNTKYIMNTFGKYDENLRVSIKMVDESNVVDIFRNTADNIVFSESEMSQNTGFSTIKDNKALYYINNNIEQSFMDGHYTNSRLNSSSIEPLKNNQVTWKECWIPYSTGENTNYNSTLIIPMSISSDNEDKESIFYKNFFEKQTEGKTNINSRAIWGYFCLDSKKKNLFNDIKDFDVLDLSFMITDILSLYLVFFYNYTSGSESVTKFLESEV